MDNVLGLMGPNEVAKYLGITTPALAARRKTDANFPDPVAKLMRGPVWTKAQIDEYRDGRVGRVGNLNPPDARRALEMCMRTFARYATSHEAKVSENLSPEKISDTLEKARVNRSLVEMIRSVLRGEKVKWPDV